MSTTKLTAGFLPLFDSALLVLAHERGFAEDEGLDVQLVRETSWANIRDRAAIGHFDFAQMLAPMPLAASLGLTPIATPMIAPVVLGLGNNCVTVSQALWQSMSAAGAPDDLDPAPPDWRWHKSWPHRRGNCAWVWCTRPLHTTMSCAIGSPPAALAPNVT
jgi:NitT/TauT family transport system ATP-binding protein